MKKTYLALALAMMAATLQGASTLDHQATIDFGFRVDHKTMPAGKYQVLWDKAHRFTFRHVETGRSAFFYAPVVDDSQSRQGMIHFACFSEGCSVASVVSGGGQVFRKMKANRNAPPAVMVKVLLRR